jgi:phospholipid/cholesterol/gamma-HCH transport system substrate-binding protein
MENRAYALSAGLFLVLLSIGLVLAALRLTGETTQSVEYVVEARLPISGLQENAPVRLRGVDVGKVRQVGFAHGDPRLIRIRISVDQNAPLTRGTYAQLGFLGITGLSFIQLDDDGSRPEKLVSSADQPTHIELRPSLIDQVSNSGQALVAESAQAARRVNVLLSEEKLSELSATMTSVRTASDNIARLTGDLHPVVRSLTRLTARTDTTLQRLDSLLGNLDGLTQDVRMRVGAIERVGQSATDIGQVSRSVETAVPRLNSALDDVSRSLRTVDRVLMRIEQQPQSLLWGRRSLPGPGEPGFIAPAGEP